MVTTSLNELIVQAKAASERGNEKDFSSEVGNKAKVKVQIWEDSLKSDFPSQGVTVNIENLLKSVKTVEDANSRGERATETAIGAIEQDIATLKSPQKPSSTASPEDLMTATKGVSQAVAKAIMAANSGDQDKVAAVANLGRKVVSDVLTVCKAAAYGCEDEATREAELKEGEDLAKEFQDLLRQVLDVSKSPSAEKRGELMTTSKGIAETVTKMAKLAEKLKGKDWIDKQGQMEMIAEKEMKKAADSIERAAQRLAELKLKRNILDENEEVNFFLNSKLIHQPQVSLENMTFDDLILESAQSITKATSSLMKAATAAQKELVSQGKMEDKAADEGDDGQWAQGLISAASLVASATQALCEAANTTIQVISSKKNSPCSQEGGDGTHMVASAKQVSKATAQLVLACQVRAGGRFCPTYDRLIRRRRNRVRRAWKD